MSDATYTVSDILEFTGAKRRTIQFMADNGVLQPMRGTDRQGTGIHRQFSRDEVVVACVAAAFAIRKLSIGEVINIASAVRDHLKRPKSREIIDDVLARRTDAFIVISTEGQGRYDSSIIEIKKSDLPAHYAKEWAALGERIDFLLNRRQRPGVIANILSLNACLAKFRE